jgi:hypothetical protein
MEESNMEKVSHVIEREDGEVSVVTNVRLLRSEIEFLESLEEYLPEKVKRRGKGPAIHRLIAVAREWDAWLAKPVRDFMRAEGMTVEEFAELAEVRPKTVTDILSLRTRQPELTTVQKIRRIVG